MKLDWRWGTLAAVVVVILFWRYLPWPVLLLGLAGGGGYLIYTGWHIWQGGEPGGSKRVTYWRGQRIELDQPQRVRMPSLRTLAPAVFYLVIGGALLLGAGALLVQQLGA